MTKPDQKAEMLGSIVAAYAARPDVGADDIVELVAKLRREFGLDPAPEQVAPTSTMPAAQGRTRPEAALPLDQAVTEDKVYCLCCGKGFKMLKRHLGAEHGLTEGEYRTLFSLPEDMPLVAPSYSKRKANYAREVGFGKYARGEHAHERGTTKQDESVS